jgi:hypothetical protein
VRYGQEPAPQCKLRQELEKDLGQADFVARWEARCLDVLIKIADYPGIDSVLRAEVLKRALTMARNGSEAFDSRLMVETANRLAGAETDNIAWYNPKNAKANAARGNAEIILKGLPDLRQLKEELARYYQEYRQDLARVASPVGWIELETQPHLWKLHKANTDALAGSCDLLVIEPDSGAAKWASVGQSLNKEPVLTVRNFKDDTEGRLVFAKPAATAGR